ncbi:MAG: response regulator transcription factor [Actinobacteria bacterium]|nr:response regulator transcription factor [Actinomycetota bacterium]
MTARETTVLHHVADGACKRVVAQRIGVAPRMVVTHVEHVLRKLGEDTRMGAATRRSSTG